MACHWEVMDFDESAVNKVEQVISIHFSSFCPTFVYLRSGFSSNSIVNNVRNTSGSNVAGSASNYLLTFYDFSSAAL